MENDNQPKRAPAADWLERFDPFAEAFFARHEVPGAAVVVVHRGAVVYRRGFGLRDREAGSPATAATRFGLASLTKSFTALTLLALEARGALRLDDAVSDYLPEFAYPGLGATQPVRLWHLASHTSGLPPLRALDYAIHPSQLGDPAEAFNDRDYTDAPRLDDTDALLAYLRRGERPALAPPGEVVSYSNEGFGLLGTVIERVAGAPLEEAMAREVFGPLGMEGATFDVATAGSSGQRTQLYTRVPDDGSPDDGSPDERSADAGAPEGRLADGPRPDGRLPAVGKPEGAAIDAPAPNERWAAASAPASNPRDGDVPELRRTDGAAANGRVIASPRWEEAPAYRASGLLKASADDLARSLAYLTAGGDARLPVTRERLAELWKPRGWVAPGAGYGLGWTVHRDYHGVSVIRHGGSLKGVSSHQGWVPELDLGLAILTNLDDVPVLRLFLAAVNAALGAPLERAAYDVPPGTPSGTTSGLQAFAGVYASGEPWGRLELRPSDANGGLRGFAGEKATDAGTVALLNDREFVLVTADGAWEGGRFHRDGTGGVSAVQFGSRWYDRQPDPAA